MQWMCVQVVHPFVQGYIKSRKEAGAAWIIRTKLVEDREQQRKVAADKLAILPCATDAECISGAALRVWLF